MTKKKIILRKEAIRKNLKTYFTGKPCNKAGHISERVTSSGGCLTCKREYIVEYEKKYKKEKKERMKIYRVKNKAKIKEYDKKYNEEHKEEIKKSSKEYYKKNKKKILKYRERNKENKQEYDKKYRLKNKDKIKIYRKENYSSIKIVKNKRIRERYKSDSQFKMQELLRQKLKKLINEGKMSKPTASLTKFSNEVIGISYEDLVKYIENKWHPHPVTGKKMTWKNHSLFGWHIDHIKPVSSFDLTKKDQQLKCFHYSNLQPLWSEENLKKSNK